ncbi:DUF1819 family protein [Clostridium guangxiense]|uniref:DUF1819 family protein n=1 Tax=Clostridium guangxiense TaxID=1662055 RepID=UPI001E2D06A8|nr:DUF1819 family protein [Clostridium guangxiense]MCD2347230.1 DUF1819 family protein [Clostridium guangxiense]
MKNELKYSASLTSDAFLYYELKQVLRLKNDGLSDSEIRSKILDENIFQYKSKESSKRLVSSIFKRVKVLDDTLIKMLLEEPMDTGKIINLYAIMKTSRLFYDFMNEVVREKLEFNYEILEKKDINIFFIGKAEQDEIVAGWSDTTTKKLKQVILKILSETGLLEDIKTCRLNRLIIPTELKAYIIGIGDKEYIEAMGEHVQ